MRRVSANYIYPVVSPPIRNGIIETEDDGTIRKIYDFGGEMVELAHTEFLNGVLVPGFINMHTHLELSNLGRIQPAGKDLPYFIENVVAKRNEIDALKAAFAADALMQRKGIVAVCDVSNSDLTISVKKQSKIAYHTFAEITGLNESTANSRLDYIKMLKSKYKQAQLGVSVSPHAPYSISQRLWQMLAEELANEDIASMHNQESSLENGMFETGTGDLIDLFRKLELTEKWHPTGKSSLLSVLDFLKSSKTLLVHNTFTTLEEIDTLQKFNIDVGFVLCPTSNLQITGKLPDIKLLRSSGFPIMLGTDSLGSGQSLDLLDEMLCLQSFAGLKFEEMLCWVTDVAAKFMGWSDLGGLTVGTKPGINLITGFDFENKKLKENAKIRKVL
jgi:cytosine/adenosine deaminase-related metal-dependent hydrolase